MCIIVSGVLRVRFFFTLYICLLAGAAIAPFMPRIIRSVFSAATFVVISMEIFVVVSFVTPRVLVFSFHVRIFVWFATNHVSRRISALMFHMVRIRHTGNSQTDTVPVIQYPSIRQSGCSSPCPTVRVIVVVLDNLVINAYVGIVIPIVIRSIGPCRRAIIRAGLYYNACV